MSDTKFTASDLLLPGLVAVATLLVGAVVYDNSDKGRPEWEQGVAAAKDGRPATENPYPPDSNSFQVWHKGYMSVCADDREGGMNALATLTTNEVQEDTNRYRPYLVTNRGKVHVLTGPFQDKEAARRSWWFSQPQDQTNELWRSFGLDWPRYSKLPGILLEITDDEVAFMVQDPGSCGYSKVEIKPPTTRVHPSWKDGWGGVTGLDNLWKYFSTGKLPPS